MDYHLIKTDKQDNGLWGLSFSISSMKSVLFMQDEDDEIKLSAILMAICEIHGNDNSNIHIEGIQTSGFIRVDIYNSKLWNKDSKIFINLEDYALHGNKLYFIKGKKRKQMYERMLKIKKLKIGF